MASQVSLPSTPQQNTTYDTYMQSLQQKLSSISMQNAATLLHVDSSAPTSGTTTTEMLSPVQEFETVPAALASPTETPKHQPFKNLNNELTKINSQTINETDEKAPPDKIEKTEKLEKTRRVSRFKVSVVVEPDPTKLIIKPDMAPDTKMAENVTLTDVTTTDVKIQDSLTLINNTMLQLQENVQSSYLSQVKNISATVPAGWTPENHAVGIPATIGNTAPGKIERKTSMDNLKTKPSTTTTTSLKKSLSYNDLANEIANLFSKPSNKPAKQFAFNVDPVVTQSNPRKISGGGRRTSKTFRRTPTIIIHPPDESTDRITNSCPNIHALIFKENCGVPTSTSVHPTASKDELNYSCPDINILVEANPQNADTNPLNKWKSCPSINAQPKPPNPLNINIDFSECLNELDALKNEVNDIKKECECLLYGCSCKYSRKQLYKYLPNKPSERKTTLKHDTYTRTVSEPNITTLPKKTPSPKKPVTPTQLLKHKIKQSLSMHDLNNSPNKHPDDEYASNYFTIHGGMEFPKHLTDFTQNYNFENDVLDKVEPELDKDNNLLAIVKCCCGIENCQNGRLQVVPITFQQLMDFNCEYNMNETFEDMLGRQQAELNALIEAHRKQQIEYMKSITDVSNRNRKDNF